MTGDRHAAYPTGLKDAPSRHRALRRRIEGPGIVVAPETLPKIQEALIKRHADDGVTVEFKSIVITKIGNVDVAKALKG